MKSSYQPARYFWTHNYTNRGLPMKFKEYLENLNKLLSERPETGEFDVVTSKDDEGNGYNLVNYQPSVGSYDEDERDFTEEKPLNAVCVN